MKKYELIKQAMCKELDEIENKIRQGQKMGMQDYELVRVLFSGLTKMKGYEGMLEYEEYEDGMSEARGRAANGRYMSYSDGYSQGYAEAMNEMGHSGHYPMYPRRY